MCRVIVQCGFGIGIIYFLLKDNTQPAFACSKLTIETLEQDKKYVQS